MSALKGGGKDRQGYEGKSWEEWKDWPEDWQAEQVWWGAFKTFIVYIYIYMVVCQRTGYRSPTGSSLSRYTGYRP